MSGARTADSQLQVAGPSRIPAGYDSEILTPAQRQHLLKTKTKLERLVGTGVPSSLLRVTNPDSDSLDGETSPIYLNSPVNAFPTSHQGWDVRKDSSITRNLSHPALFSVTTSSSSDPLTDLQSESPGCNNVLPPAAPICVEPLNFRRRPRGKSHSLPGIELEMTAAQRDAVFAGEPGGVHNQNQNQLLGPWQQEAGASSVARSQSLSQTQLPGVPRRYPRPLPPLPLSRPTSPGLSECSGISHYSPRPLPKLPTRASLDSSSAPPSPCTLSPPHVTSTPQLTFSRMPAPHAASPSESEPPSPSTPVSSIADSFQSFSFSTSMLASPGIKKSSHIHAFPYKCARSPSLYSTTSLSSQVSVPPVPPSAEIWRRKRKKMSKLVRVLGERPPCDLVFANERGFAPGLSEPIEEEDGDRAADLLATTARVRSASMDDEGARSDADSSEDGNFRKTMSDPDAGHGTRTQSPTPPRASTPSRLRNMVSLSGAVRSLSPARLAFKFTTGVKPIVSYLQDDFDFDTKQSEADLPLSVPLRLPALDLLPKVHQWVRENGQDRWEVNDYDNVVQSLRKL